METRDILADAFGRIRDEVHQAAAGLDGAALAYRPDPDSNSIAWLIWHLTRVQDDHLSEIAALPQAWIADGWAARLGMVPDPADTGYGHTSAQVGSLQPANPDMFLAYHDAVYSRTLGYLETVNPEELDRIIDRRWDPPVTVGVRLVSVIDDCIQHTGQANYVRGMIERRA